jgi:transposase
MKQRELTDGEWTKLVALLPPEKPATGHPNKDHRQVMNGILWVVRTGSPWRDVPERYGPWSTIASRFYRWRKQGVWQRVFESLQEAAQQAGRINWRIHFVDATIVRAHQHAAGAAHSSPEAEGLGRSRGGWSTKLHVRVEGDGKPMTFILTPGQQHESTVAQQLLEQGAVSTGRSGPPRRRPQRLIADKGYSSRKFRAFLRRRAIRFTIPHQRRERFPGPFNPQLYRLRNQVERFFNRLKQNRRIATRYEKQAVNYLAIVTFAAIRLWL